ncbi:MAG TPA: alpha/beta hydrolase, partial [Chitinophagaceae bacterium]|nr:alpha/beta hydrolase [Chitinophagaceae bacterium]
MPTIVWYILMGIIVLSILAYVLQERLIFKPEKLKQDFLFKYDAPFKEYFFDIALGVRINALHFYRENPKGLILYFHGNTRSIKGWAR